MPINPKHILKTIFILLFDNPLIEGLHKNYNFFQCLAIFNCIFQAIFEVLSLYGKLDEYP